MDSSYFQLQFGQHNTSSKDDILGDLQAAIFCLAEKGCHKFLRWRQGISLMLEKKPDLHGVDKMGSMLKMEK